MSYNGGDVLGWKFDRKNCLGRVSLDSCIPESRPHKKKNSERPPFEAKSNSLLTERRLVTPEKGAEGIEHYIAGESKGRSVSQCPEGISQSQQLHPREYSGRKKSLSQPQSGYTKAVEEPLQRRDSTKVEPKASFEDSRFLSAGRFDLLRLESLVLRMEAAIHEAQVIPSWVSTLLVEPTWSVRVRNHLRSEDFQKQITETPTTAASPCLTFTPDNVDSLWHEVPSPPMDSIVRDVVTEILPVIKEDVSKLFDDVLREQADVISATPVALGASSIRPWSAEVALAISEALLPQLQRPLAAEIIDELSARHAFPVDDASGTGSKELHSDSPRVWFRGAPSIVGDSDDIMQEQPLHVSQVRPTFRSTQHSRGSRGTPKSSMRPRKFSTGSADSADKQSERQSYAMMPFHTETDDVTVHYSSEYRHRGKSRSADGFLLSKSGSRSPHIRHHTRSFDSSNTFLTHVSGLDTLPHNSFVVNFQRLILMRKIFQVIHEFINSTVVASLTLVKVANFYQLVVSVIFMFCAFLIYTAHYWHYDTLEISDYKNLCDLLGDDDDVCNNELVDNPNRLIKALAFSRRGIRKLAICCVNAFMSLCAVSLWTFFLFRFVGIVDYEFDHEDKELTLTLLLVGSMVVLFHLLYEWLFWRETQCIMPPSPYDPKRPWDPREHGLPLGLRWFGLPSMWFTSERSALYLRRWISKAKGIQNNKIVHSIYPQEIALLALEKEHARTLTAVLRHAKLYDARTGDFFLHDNGVCRPVTEDECPEELDIELVYFDNFQHVRGQVGRGEFLQPEEEYQKTSLKRVTQRGSLAGRDSRDDDE